MKYIRNIVALGLTVLLLSCTTTKSTTSSSTSKSNRGRSNVETATSANRNASSSRIANEKIEEQDKRLKEVELSMHMKKMYGDLNMTEDQIARFERDWNHAQQKWKAKNHGRTMNNFERVEHQDKILRGILDDRQFEDYQAWMRENADWE